MVTQAQTLYLPDRRPTLQRLLDNIQQFLKTISRNRGGFIGFLGLLVYVVLVVIGPLIVPFDNVVRLDEIAAPPGSRIQLLTRAEDAAQYTTLESLAGKTVGIIDNTGGEALVAPYADTFEVDSTRWRSGRGVEDAIESLAEGDIDALVLFSESVKKHITNNPDATHLAVSNAALGPAHLLGTDTQGRDIFSHIVNGGGSLILTAVVAGILSTLIAVALGALAALGGGFVDRAITAVANFVLVVPRFPLLVVLASFIQLNNVLLLAGLIALLSWPSLMRAVRSQVLSLRERDYVEAAVALNLGTWHIILREILPNMISFVAISLIFAITEAMYSQVGLIFLGMAPISDYNWGVMIFFGRSRGTLFSPDSAAMVLAPIIAIAFFQVSMVLFARGLEEAFDPRLRGRA